MIPSEVQFFVNTLRSTFSLIEVDPSTPCSTLESSSCFLYAIASAVEHMRSKCLEELCNCPQ